MASLTVYYQRQKKEMTPAENQAFNDSDRFEDLIAAGLLKPGQRLIYDHDGTDLVATVGADGQLRIPGTHDRPPTQSGTPSGLLTKALGGNRNGWDLFQVELEDGTRIPLQAIRAQYYYRLLADRVLEPAETVTDNRTPTDEEPDNEDDGEDRPGVIGLLTRISDDLADIRHQVNRAHRRASQSLPPPPR